MASLSDAGLDAALAVWGDADALYLCTQEPTTYAEASSTYAVAVKATPSIGAVGDRSGGGRKRTVAAITDGEVTANGTPSHWALTKASGSLLRATGAITNGQLVYDGNTFTLAAFDIGVPDAA